MERFYDVERGIEFLDTPGQSFFYFASTALITYGDQALMASR